MADRRRRGARSGRKQQEGHERGARRKQRGDRGGGDEGGAPSWLLPLLGLIVLAVVLFLVIRGCGDDEPTDTASTSTTIAATSQPGVAGGLLPR